MLAFFSSFFLQESNNVAHVPRVACLPLAMRPNHSQDAVAAHIHTMAPARAVECESRPKDNPLQVREAHPRRIPLQSCQVIRLAGHARSVTKCGYNRKRVFPPPLVAPILRFTVSLCYALRTAHSALFARSVRVSERSNAPDRLRSVLTTLSLALQHERASLPACQRSRDVLFRIQSVHSYCRTSVCS